MKRGLVGDAGEGGRTWTSAFSAMPSRMSARNSAKRSWYLQDPTGPGRNATGRIIYAAESYKQRQPNQSINQPNPRLRRSHGASHWRMHSRAPHTDSLSQQRQRRECTSAARHSTARREMRWHERGRNVQRHRPRVLNERDEIIDDALRQGRALRVTAHHCSFRARVRGSGACLAACARTHGAGGAVRCLPDRSGARGC